METSADFTLLDLHNFPDNTQPHQITVKYPEFAKEQANGDGNQGPITMEVGMWCTNYFEWIILQLLEFGFRVIW